MITQISRYGILSLALLIAIAFAACATQQREAKSRITQRLIVAETEGSAPLPITHGDFSSSTPDAIRDAHPSNTGGNALRDAVVTDAGVSEAVAKMGIPDAIEFHSRANLRTRWFEMYYRNPPNTYVFERTRSDIVLLASGQSYRSRQVAQLSLVPRSAEILGFGNGPMPPPWPVTLTPNLYNYFDVPTRPHAPPSYATGADYYSTSMAIAALVTKAAQNAAVRRVKDAFLRLAGVARMNGINWELVVFDAPEPIGFSVDDGHVFVSTGLADQLDETQALCVVAHLMGHVRYQHAQEVWQRHDRWVAQQTVIDTAGSIAGAVWGPFGGLGPESVQAIGDGVLSPPATRIANEHYVSILTSPLSGYTRSQENEADAAAAAYLADLKIPPDAIFYTMMKLAPQPGVSVPTSIRFINMHHYDWAVPDTARMLDAGHLNAQ